MKKKTIIIIGIIILGLIFMSMILLRGNKKSMVINTTTAKYDSIMIEVTATGYIQPVTKVDVGTQVSGVIERIYVDFNSQVVKGQLLAELDKSTLREKLRQADAALSTAQSDMAFAQQNYDRIEHLYEAKAATLTSFEEATNKLMTAKNSVTRAQADVQQAQVNLSYADIFSPIAGVVLNREVDEGQTVAASFNTPTLFTIANDLTKMQVEADVDEADIGSVRAGQHVYFTVDSYPDDVFTGTVQQVRLQPTVTSNVVTYVVIIEAPNPDEKLYPGMTASVTIITDNMKGVTVPVEALRFQPDEKALEMMDVENGLPIMAGENSVWVKNGEGYKPVALTIGINDGVNTLVTNGLEVGDTIVLSVQEVANNHKNGQAVNIMPRPGGRPPR